MDFRGTLSRTYRLTSIHTPPGLSATKSDLSLRAEDFVRPGQDQARRARSKLERNEIDTVFALCFVRVGTCRRLMPYANSRATRDDVRDAA